MNNSCISYASLNDKVKTKRQNIHCNHQQLFLFFQYSKNRFITDHTLLITIFVSIF